MLNEIKNDDFFVLLKYIQAKDYHGFYTSLDTLIEETIPDFYNFDVIEKATVYMAMCFYSVHNSITIGNKIFGTSEINLSILLNAIEESYKSLPKSFTYNLNEDTEVEIGLPKIIDTDHSSVSVNYISGIKKIRGIEIKTKEDIDKISYQLSTKMSMKIEHMVKKYYRQICRLFEDLTVNLIGDDMFLMIFQIYAEKLEDFYEILYYHFEYLKWNFDTFNRFTPLETRAMFNLFKVDKEKQAQEREREMQNR